MTVGLYCSLPEIANSQAISNRYPKRKETVFVRNKIFHRSCLHHFTLMILVIRIQHRRVCTVHLIHRVAQIFAQFKREKNLVKYPEAFAGLLPLTLLIFYMYFYIYFFLYKHIKKSMVAKEKYATEQIFVLEKIKDCQQTRGNYINQLNYCL